MKHLITLLTLVCACFLNVSGQDAVSVKARYIIDNNTLDITWHKTTVLIFPAAIKSADRGDSYILAEQPEGVENILKVKAGKRFFQESNLHVVTTDGKVYAFTVNYADYPSTFTIDVGRHPPHSPVTFEGVSLNSRDIELAVATIKGIEPFVRRVKSSRHGMELRLEGIFIKGDVLFLRYNLKNKTQIRYDSTPPRFFIRDKKRAKRTAVQDTEVEPLTVHYNGAPEADDGQTITVAFEKFTIAESKNFVTEFREHGGDRTLDCRFDQKKLLQAKTID
ncbi:conjugative transposon protein TraN [Sphingobacterium phlebotomi]|uniref:Conjugative transposon protein TraN n=1 Tax=Sphingobacterium phlebotomi TaxID=2605433 RepID=A0A5D4HCZ3_9SPHI|nr:conjugative transposon protein TraN [Sphingobacterium phlebotomi]TYR37405.1 conjugative transposon protein TraN [Sphingobacterium phlebotomi]